MTSKRSLEADDTVPLLKVSRTVACADRVVQVSIHVGSLGSVGFGVVASSADDQYECSDKHVDRLVLWKSLQSHVYRASLTEYGGMISFVNVEESYLEHKRVLKTKGYKFGTYGTDRSLFERMDRLVFQHTYGDMGRVVLHEAKSILQHINTGAMPERNTFSMLVMHSVEYIRPIVDLISLLTHSRADCSDLNLFWELLDRLWCFAHPIYYLHSGYLDETSQKITTRLCTLLSETS